MSPEGRAFLRTVFAQLRLPLGCVRLWQICRTSRIRDSRDSPIGMHFTVATGVNEHPCAVTPLGHVHVPSLPVAKRVPRISNLSCIYICPQANIIPGGCLTLQRLFCYKKSLPSSRHRILRLFLCASAADL